MVSLYAVALAIAAANAAPPSIPPAIYTDPAPDAAHPARMEVLHIPSGGVAINAIAYVPTGAGPHPVLVLCHGWPGNEKNLDLAQAVRRAGWIVVTFNYRGSWGSPGTFSFAHNPEDAAAVIAWLRHPAHAAMLGADAARIAIAGHSMGAWVSAKTIAHDSRLLGAALISLGDVGVIGKTPRADLLKLIDDNAETLVTTREAEAKEFADDADKNMTVPDAAAIAKRPLFVLTADDGLAPMDDALAAAVRKAGGTVTTFHAATDHSWSDHRIALEAAIIDWLGTLR
ncbi:MAG: alpha/beta hydrolase [Pseudomonadota bacterium]|nr:alpha/beta hydrolase [Pseudomonadota bacterium]